MTKGERTRELFLDAAEPMIIERGYVGTSLDDILKVTGLTKGAFFNHFKGGKSELARALVERYAQRDFELFAGFAAEANARSDDPLEAALLSLRLFEEFLDGLASPPQGCLFAAYTYESQQFDPAITAFIRDSFRRWSAQYETQFAAVLARYRPAQPTSARELAEMIIALIQGGFILSRNYRDRTLIVRQSRQFRQYLELLFAAKQPA